MAGLVSPFFVARTSTETTSATDSGLQTSQQGTISGAAAPTSPLPVQSNKPKIDTPSVEAACAASPMAAFSRERASQAVRAGRSRASRARTP